MKRKFWLLCTLGCLFAAYVIFSSRASNPPNGRTNAPFDGFCTDCHNPSTAIDGTVSLGGIPDTITGGQTYEVTLTAKATQGAPVRAGYQLVSVFSSDYTNAGELIATSGSGLNTADDRVYIEQRGARSISDSSVSWSFEWIAPETTEPSSITMFYAANLVNGNGSTGGDRPVSDSSVFITQAAEITPLVISSTVQDVLCNGDSSGVIEINAEQGNPPYSISWNTGDTSSVLSQLPAGSYSYTLTDALDQEMSETVEVGQPDSIVLAASVTDATGQEVPDGTIMVEVNGGTPPYSIEWNTGDTTALVENLLAGTYSVTLTDGSGCQIADSVIVLFETTTNAGDHILTEMIRIAPNPMQEYTEIVYSSGVTGFIELRIISVEGREVVKAAHRISSAGIIRTDVSRLQSGIYFFYFKNGKKGCVIRALKL